MTQAERYQDAYKYVQKRKDFWVHLALFLIVNANLITLNLAKTPDKLWFHWVLMGWGAGLLLNGFQVFGNGFAKNWEARKIEEIVKRDAVEEAARPKSTSI